MMSHYMAYEGILADIGQGRPELQGEDGVAALGEGACDLPRAAADLEQAAAGGRRACWTMASMITSG